MDKTMLVNSLKSVAAAILLAAILIFGVNLIISSSSDPMKNLTVFAYGILFVTAFAGGAVTSLFNQEKGLIGGALTGGMLAAIICIGYAVICKEFSIGKAVLFFILITALSALGGLVFLPKQKSMAKRRKELIKNRK